MPITLFNKQQTALFLRDGDFWTAISDHKETNDYNTQLHGLYATADALDDPTELMGTMTDDTQVCIGTSPRRPHRP